MPLNVKTKRFSKYETLLYHYKNRKVRARPLKGSSVVQLHKIASYLHYNLYNCIQLYLALWEYIVQSWQSGTREPGSIPEKSPSVAEFSHGRKAVLKCRLHCILRESKSK